MKAIASILLNGQVTYRPINYNDEGDGIVLTAFGHILSSAFDLAAEVFDHMNDDRALSIPPSFMKFYRSQFMVKIMTSIYFYFVAWRRLKKFQKGSA